VYKILDRKTNLINLLSGKMVLKYIPKNPEFEYFAAALCRPPGRIGALFELLRWLNVRPGRFSWGTI
jgi:hypothetical protein